VEVAQQKLRTIKPPSPAPANSLQRARAAVPPDVLTPLAQDLVGKTGLIAFDVVDVYDNTMLVVGPPSAVAQFRHTMPYLVRAEYDSQTSARLSDAQQQVVRRRQAQGDVQAAARMRDAAEAARPKHLLWIVSDDEKVKKWGRRSRQNARCEVVSASLRPVTGGYIQAVVVLKMRPASPATAPTAQPTS
jgi:hypothetical protein